MNTSKMKLLALLGTIALGTTLARADATLKIGDPAPKLQTGKWIQGEPVKDFQKGKAYIVEFWATWCGPCKASIPHLNETYTKFKDKGLIVIGQDCWERDESLVAPFVEKMGEKMTYRVALDDKTANEKGKMAETWMEAAGRNGIPSAFLVDTKGIVAWIGHPMTLQEKVIEEVLAGNFDLRKAAEQFDREQKTQTAWMNLNRDLQQKKWDEASDTLAEIEKQLPEGSRDSLDMPRLSILFGKEEYPAAYKMAAQLSQAHITDAMYQNELAWRIATDKSIKQRDLPLAETIARRGVAASKGEDPSILDTLARVLFLQNKKEDAIGLQEKAVKLADGDLKSQLQNTLDSYKRGELSKAN